jgi:hypothetical protein
MSLALVNMVTTELLMLPEAVSRLNPKGSAKFLAPQTFQLGNQVYYRNRDDKLLILPWKNVAESHSTSLDCPVQFCNIRILTTVMKDLIRKLPIYLFLGELCGGSNGDRSSEIRRAISDLVDYGLVSCLDRIK